MGITVATPWNYWLFLMLNVSLRNLWIGNGCGYSKGWEDHPFLYWPSVDPTEFANPGLVNVDRLLDRTVCAKSCPKEESEIKSSGFCMLALELSITKLISMAFPKTSKLLTQHFMKLSHIQEKSVWSNRRMERQEKWETKFSNRLGVILNFLDILEIS